MLNEEVDGPASESLSSFSKFLEWLDEAAWRSLLDLLLCAASLALRYLGRRLVEEDCVVWLDEDMLEVLREVLEIVSKLPTLEVEEWDLSSSFVSEIKFLLIFYEKN